jgi:hypothetical protein
MRRDADTAPDNSLGIAINYQRRTAGKKSDASTLRVTNKQRVSSRGVEKSGLTEDEIAAAERRYREVEGKKAEDGKAINYPDRIYRVERKRPLLIVHLLKIDTEKDAIPQYREPIVAWSISFPKTAMDERRVEYVVNTTWLRENFRDETDEDDMEGDHD